MNWDLVYLIFGVLCWAAGIRRCYYAARVFMSAQSYYLKGQRLREEAIAKQQEARASHDEATEAWGRAIVTMERVKAIAEEHLE